METLRHKCKIVLSIFVSLLLMVVSVNASLAEGDNLNVKTLSTTLSENNITLTFSAIVDASIPEDTTLNVKKVINTDSSYKYLEKKLNDQADKDHYINTAFSLYDYKFTSNNQEVTPSGDVTITMAYNQAYAPASITNDDELALMRLSDPAVNFTKDEQTKISFADQSNKVNQVIYKTSSHDPIALAWREKKQSVNSIKVHYVNAKDTSKDLVTKTLSASELNGNIDLNTLSKALENTDVTTYTYQKTTLDTASGTIIVGAKAEKVNDLTKLYYIPQGSADYTPYKGEGESYDVNLYMLYNVEEKKDTSDQLDTADQLTSETKDSADQSETKTESNSQSSTTQSSTADTKTKEKDTADQLTTQTDTKDTTDQLTSSSTDTADQTKASDTADQVKDNTSSTTPSKKLLKRAVLRAAPAANTTKEAPGTLKIVDDIAKSGQIQAKYSNEIPENAQFTWYRTKDGKESVVIRKNTGGTYNIHYDDSKATYVDVAADEGNEVWKKANGIKYRVVLTYTNNGVTYTKESDTWTLKYFGQLENGDFEQPVLENETKYSWDGNKKNAINGYIANYDANDPDKPKNYNPGTHFSPKGIWKTTSDYRSSTQRKAGTDIEIANTQNEDYLDSYDWSYSDYWGYIEPGAFSGNQFAELNAESSGALYQDVLTHPNKNMYYSLAHRARSEKNMGNYTYWNSMYLVIAPLSEVKEIKTQNQLQNFINKCKEGLYSSSLSDRQKSIGHQIVYQNKEKGILIEKIVSNNRSWNHISSEVAYLPTSSATRFFFVAGASTGNNTTVGNFLDKVEFSQNLPTPTNDTFNLTVSKTFTGLKASELAKMSQGTKNPFTLTITNRGSSNSNSNSYYKQLNNLKLQFKAAKTTDGYTLTPLTSTGKEMDPVPVNNEATNITLNWIFKEQQIDDSTFIFKVTENNYSLDDYKVATSNTADGEAGTQNSVTNEITIGKKQSHSFTFANNYVKIQKSNLTISKAVTGNQADFTKYFEFHVVIQNVDANKEYQLDTSHATAEKNQDPLKSNNKGTIDGYVYLKNGESIIVKELIIENEGATYNVSEDNTGYETTYKLDQEISKSGKSTGAQLFGENSHTIAFTNTKNGEIPTGTQKNPLITIPLIIAGIGFVLYILKKKNEVE